MKHMSKETCTCLKSNTLYPLQGISPWIIESSVLQWIRSEEQYKLRTLELCLTIKQCWVKMGSTLCDRWGFKLHQSISQQKQLHKQFKLSYAGAAALKCFYCITSGSKHVIINTSLILSTPLFFCSSYTSRPQKLGQVTRGFFNYFPRPAHDQNFSFNFICDKKRNPIYFTPTCSFNPYYNKRYVLNHLWTNSHLTKPLHPNDMFVLVYARKHVLFVHFILDNCCTAVTFPLVPFKLEHCTRSRANYTLTALLEQNYL